MKQFLKTGSIFLLLATPTVQAADLGGIELLDQQDFRLFSEDAASALSYKAVEPAEPLGWAGFDIALEITATDMKNAAAWVAAVSDGEIIDTIVIPRLHFHKGLPLGIDFGIAYSEIPGYDISTTGFEVSYAFLDGSTLMPALALRYTMSDVSGIDELDFSTQGLELTISKGFAMFTPYGGIGRVETDSTPKGIAAEPFPGGAGLVKESFTVNKTYIGVNINVLVMDIGLEWDKTGENNSYTAKFGFRF